MLEHIFQETAGAITTCPALGPYCFSSPDAYRNKNGEVQGASTEFTHALSQTAKDLVGRAEIKDKTSLERSTLDECCSWVASNGRHDLRRFRTCPKISKSFEPHVPVEGRMTSQASTALGTLSFSRQTGLLQWAFMTSSGEVSPVMPRTKNGLYHILKKCCTTTPYCRSYIQRSIRLPKLSCTGK